jgi:hypothetical protein
LRLFAEAESARAAAESANASEKSAMASAAETRVRSLMAAADARIAVEKEEQRRTDEKRRMLAKAMEALREKKRKS